MHDCVEIYILTLGCGVCVCTQDCLRSERVELYDPILESQSSTEVFTTMRNEFLNDLCGGVQWIGRNEECRRTITTDHHTLFFMPHCSRTMYENVIASNFCPERLHRVVILGNTFDGYRLTADSGSTLRSPLDIVEPVHMERHVTSAARLGKSGTKAATVASASGFDFSGCGLGDMSLHFFSSDINSDIDIFTADNRGSIAAHLSSTHKKNDPEMVTVAQEEREQQGSM